MNLIKPFGCLILPFYYVIELYKEKKQRKFKEWLRLSDTSILGLFKNRIRVTFGLWTGKRKTHEAVEVYMEAEQGVRYRETG